MPSAVLCSLMKLLVLNEMVSVCGEKKMSFEVSIFPATQPPVIHYKRSLKHKRPSQNCVVITICCAFCVKGVPF